MELYTSTDAEEIMALAQTIFYDSSLCLLETLEDYRKYSGWIIRNESGCAVAFLIYTCVSPSLYYIEFLGSQLPGSGQLLLSTFLAFIDASNSASYLHIERSGKQIDRLSKWYTRNGFLLIDSNPQLYPFLTDSESMLLYRAPANKVE